MKRVGVLLLDFADWLEVEESANLVLVVGWIFVETVDA
jgi:hypothetical protein